MSQSNQTSQSYFEDFQNEEPREINEASDTTKNGLTLRKLEGGQILLDKELTISWETKARLDPSILSTEVEITGDAYGGVDIEFYDQSAKLIGTERLLDGSVTFRSNTPVAYIIIPYDDPHGRAVINRVRWSKQ
ncbi:hypothetical protein [Pseudomonas gozinkensis]|uniref:hypothetical protein n=1 Tax=Pseudomonas gozinkensis TaxID=2774461 RepID=UPI0017884A38|nr:hypothetical protein [Pseudomonas gozinkensis]